jgi:hypothetical protein
MSLLRHPQTPFEEPGKKETRLRENAGGIFMNWIGGKAELPNAETVGFEPTEPNKGFSTLAGWCTRPNYATSPERPQANARQPS